MKDRILAAVDIVDVIGERVALKLKGREYLGLCPFHADHNPSMSVSPTKQIFKCWSCGEGGDVIKFVQKFHKLEFRAALELLAERAGIAFDRNESPRNVADRDALRKVMEWAVKWFERNLASDAGRGARDYAERRGIRPETIQDFNLGFAPEAWDGLISAAERVRVPAEQLLASGLVGDSTRGKRYDRFRNRLIFPIRDALGRPVALGGRALGDDPAKYLNSPETPLFSKSRVLYAFDKARDAIAAEKAAIVVEGYMDVVMLHQAGIRNVVAALGTALTDQHVKLLRPITQDVYLCFDSDEAGMRAADRALETALKHRLNVRVVLLSDGQDPADCVVAGGADAFRQRLLGAVDALEFKWAQTVASYGQQGPQARRVALEAFLEFIARLGNAGGIDPLAEGMLVGRLSELVGMPPTGVHQLLGVIKSRRSRTRPSGDADGSDANIEQEVSSYERDKQALPRGLVAAVEAAFGLVLAEWPADKELSEMLQCAIPLCRTWAQLWDRLVESGFPEQTCCKTDVLPGVDDAATCELIAAAAERTPDDEIDEETANAVRQRLAEELRAQRSSALHHDLRSSDAEPDQRAAFSSLIQAARERNGLLPGSALR